MDVQVRDALPIYGLIVREQLGDVALRRGPDQRPTEIVGAIISAETSVRDDLDRLRVGIGSQEPRSPEATAFDRGHHDGIPQRGLVDGLVDPGCALDEEIEPMPRQRCRLSRTEPADPVALVGVVDGHHRHRGGVQNTDLEGPGPDPNPIALRQDRRMLDADFVQERPVGASQILDQPVLILTGDRGMLA